jgi:hypothetical protein
VIYIPLGDRHKIFARGALFCASSCDAKKKSNRGYTKNLFHWFHSISSFQPPLQSDKPRLGSLAENCSGSTRLLERKPYLVKLFRCYSDPYTDLEILGIAEAELKFQPMPHEPLSDEASPAEDKVKAVADIKREVGRLFGVPASAVEIAIRP